MIFWEDSFDEYVIQERLDLAKQFNISKDLPLIYPHVAEFENTTREESEIRHLVSKKEATALYQYVNNRNNYDEYLGHMGLSPATVMEFKDQLKEDRGECNLGSSSYISDFSDQYQKILSEITNNDVNAQISHFDSKDFKTYNRLNKPEYLALKMQYLYTMSYILTHLPDIDGAYKGPKKLDLYSFIFGQYYNSDEIRRAINSAYNEKYIQEYSIDNPKSDLINHIKYATLLLDEFD